MIDTEARLLAARKGAEGILTQKMAEPEAMEKAAVGQLSTGATQSCLSS